MKANVVAFGLALGLSAASSVTAADGDVLAFYPFCDGENGESARALELTNSVDNVLYRVSSTTDVAWTSDVKFTDSTPGRFLFDGLGYHAQPFVKRFASLNVTGRNNNNGSAFGGEYSSQMELLGLASALSSNESWTVEFFYYLPANQYLGYAPAISFNAGLGAYKDGNLVSGKLSLMPSSVTTQWRIQIKDENTEVYPIITDTPTPYLDRWMHIAIVYDKGDFSLYLDYDKKVTVSTVLKGEPNSGEPVVLANKKARGMFSAFRATKKALESHQFLRASDNPTRLDETAFAWTLEGDVGAEVETGSAYSELSGKSPVYGHRRKGRVMLGGKFLRHTSSAVRFTTESKADAEAIFAKGMGLALAKDSIEPLFGDFTMEAFVKFDKEPWERKVGDHAINGIVENRKRVSVFGQQYFTSSYQSLWCLGFDKLNNAYEVRVGVVCYSESSNTYTPLTLKGAKVNTDGKWHHYALTYDASTWEVCVYEDGAELLREVLQAPMAYVRKGEQPAYWIGAGGVLGNQPFEGLMDEVRLSRRILSPGEFLEISTDLGMSVTVR